MNLTCESKRGIGSKSKSERVRIRERESISESASERAKEGDKVIQRERTGKTSHKHGEKEWERGRARE